MSWRRRELEYRWRANSLWLVPMACIAAGAAAVAVTLTIDGAVGYDLLPTSVLGTPTAVQLAWPGYVAVAFEELVGVGSSSPVVSRRLLAALEDLIAVAPTERHPPLESQRQRLLDCADKAGIAMRPDVQGLGAAHELTSRRDGAQD